MTREQAEITQLLQAWDNGDQSAFDKLFPLVFEELHKLAVRRFNDERAQHTLQPTALINELYFNIRGGCNLDWKNRAQFFAVAAHRMRQILIDHARRKRAEKRGSGEQPISLDAVGGDVASGKSMDVIRLNDALEELEKLSPELAKIVELRYFAGLSVAETAAVLDAGERTIKRKWQTARAWLYKSMKGEDE